MSRPRTSAVFSAYLTTLDRAFAKAYSVCVSPSVCHTANPRLNGPKYRNILNTDNRAMFGIFDAKFRSREFMGSLQLIALKRCTPPPPKIRPIIHNDLKNSARYDVSYNPNYKLVRRCIRTYDW